MRTPSLFLVVLLSAPAVFAEDLSGRNGMGLSPAIAVPMGSAFVRDRGGIDLDPGGWYKRGLTERWSLGASYDMYIPGKIRIQNYFANVYYQILPSSRFNPYARLGLGLSHIRGFATPREEALGLKLGGGGDYFFQEDMSVGAEIGYHLTGKNSPSGHEAHLFYTAVTVGWWFGGGWKEAAPGSAGAGPSPYALAAAPVSADADADGISDPKDRCPGTPAGTAVTSMGCLKGEKVSIELRMQFDSGKSKVKRKYDDQLVKVAELLRTYPDVTAEIEGHTDNMGKAEKNKALSQERADAVRAALIERFRASPDRLTAVGYGQERPAASNGSEAGRAKNRRVVASFAATQD
ncbi:MAG: hypothetical protein A2X36_10575 [Elusimicrobia bacterium GWA2_69_24]|nr:MAG: hypothetical protein A2X36_10575 [Elusimicrobia bacterium GWA2_69_24]HBL17898.1 hypothetical protein [Elusimicrobiota bacterium]